MTDTSRIYSRRGQRGGKERVYARLSQDVYRQLESQLPRAVIDKQSDASVDAGYKLGIQLVLQKLREGFVIEE